MDGSQRVTPYYQDESVTLFLGDCREVLPALGAFDVLLTDPPYGIGAAKRSFISHKKGVKSRLGVATDYGDSDWDNSPPPAWLLEQARSMCQWSVIFGGNYFDLPPTKCWLVWDKDNGDSGFADCELVWTNLDKAVRRLTYRWNGMLQQPGVPREFREHPTQKPEAVIRWALSHVPDPFDSVLDPFAGSGTTLVEAKRRGKRAVGIEREERYCEIAAKRCAQGSLAEMFA